MKLWDDVLKFDCIYQQDGQVRVNYNWSGYVKSEYLPYHSDNGASFSLEGVTIENQISQIHNRKRYLFAFPGFVLQNHSKMRAPFPAKAMFTKGFQLSPIRCSDLRTSSIIFRVNWPE